MEFRQSEKVGTLVQVPDLYWLQTKRIIDT